MADVEKQELQGLESELEANGVDMSAIEEISKQEKQLAKSKIQRSEMQYVDYGVEAGLLLSC